MDKSDDRRFKILFVMDSLFTGGAEFSTLTLAGWLKQQQEEVMVICLKQMAPCYSPGDFGLTENVITLKATSFLGRLKELNVYVRRFQPRIIHSVLLNANFTCRILKLFHRRPVFVESLVNRTYDKARFRDGNVSRTGLRMYQWLDSLSQRWGTDYFHAVTRDIADHFNEKTGIAKAKTEVIYRGRNSNPWISNKASRDEIRTELGLEADELVFLNIGRHEYQKGQIFLMEAFRCFREKYNGRARLLIAGREGHESRTLRDFLVQHNLGGSIHLLGHRKDTPRLLAASEVMVMSSVFEGIGGVLIEAEAAGLPIVCSDLAGLKEVVEPDGNALMAAPGNAGELCTAMLTLAMNPSLRQRMGARSVQIFGERFEMEISNDLMMSLYRRILDCNK